MFEKSTVKGKSFMFVFGYLIKILNRLNNPMLKGQYSLMKGIQETFFENKKGINKMNIPIKSLENIKNPIIRYNIFLSIGLSFSILTKL